MRFKTKIISGLLLFTVYNLLHTNIVHAAFLTITKEGQIISQVLGSSTIKVKEVAQNITSPGSLISLTNSNGKIELNGIDVTNIKENLVEVEARDNTNDLKINEENGQFNISENEITATTQYPITINPDKNTLSVETPSGDRLLSILPYEAAATTKNGKFIDQINENKITLNETSKGELEYQVKGIKNVNLFNIAKIKAEVSAEVSATTGEILNINEPQWLKIFGFMLY